MEIKTSKIKNNFTHIMHGHDISQGEGVSDRALTLPNILTLMRIIMTPIIVMLLLGNEMALAFYLFAFAVGTDFIDGWVAKNFNAQTRFGAFLDPVADKILTFSIYLWLGLSGLIPDWFVVLIISRDVFILFGILITWLAFDRLWIAPLGVGKLTTFAQLTLAGVVLVGETFANQLPLPIAQFDRAVEWAVYGVAALTCLSIAAYASQWFIRISISDKEDK